MEKLSEVKTLLAIDGGGLFGVGVANWMPKLENYKFDYYAGTSVGSILAACYAIGMTTEEVKDKFNSGLSERIFKKPGFPENCNPLRPATYVNSGAKEVFKEVFGDKLVCETKFPIVIVA
jgi:predicted acylesterase/phospholipase RssA